jgi:hypothetical protein
MVGRTVPLTGEQMVSAIATRREKVEHQYAIVFQMQARGTGARIYIQEVLWTAVSYQSSWSSKLFFAR